MQKTDSVCARKNRRRHEKLSREEKEKRKKSTKRRKFSERLLGAYGFVTAVALDVFLCCCCFFLFVRCVCLFVLFFLLLFCSSPCYGPRAFVELFILRMNLRVENRCGPDESLDVGGGGVWDLVMVVVVIVD